MYALLPMACAALALAGCSTSAHPVRQGESFVPGTGLESVVPVKDRGAPLELAGSGLNGEHLDLAKFRGHVVVVNIWGAWCDACRAEAAGIEKVARADTDKGVSFIGIDTRDLQTAQPRAFVKSRHLSYPSFYDPAGELLLRFPKGIFNPQAVPTTLVLDRSGRLAVRALKAVSADELTDMIAPVLAERS